MCTKSSVCVWGKRGAAYRSEIACWIHSFAWLANTFFLSGWKKRKCSVWWEHQEGSQGNVQPLVCSASLGSSLFGVSRRLCAVGLLIAHFNRCDPGLHGPRLTPRKSCGWAAADTLWLTRRPALHPAHSKWQSASSPGINLHLPAKGRRHPAKGSVACASLAPLSGEVLGRAFFSIWNTMFPIQPRETPICLHSPWWQIPWDPLALAWEEALVPRRSARLGCLMWCASCLPRRGLGPGAAAEAIILRVSTPCSLTSRCGVWSSAASL